MVYFEIQFISLAFFLNSNFWIFPVEVFGSSQNSIFFGTLNLAKVSLQKSINSFSVTVLSLTDSINAQGTSPHFSSGFDTTAAIAPPDGMVFVAITMVEDCNFNSTNGLVAEDENKWFNSDAAAHNESAASETSLQGSGGVELDDGNVFPAGMTIYGRYIDIKLAGGSCIAYLG